MRTDKEIVEQTEALAVYLLAWGFNHQPETSTPLRDSAHPFAQRAWVAACHIQEMLTDTDPENAVAELDDALPAPPVASDLLDYDRLFNIIRGTGYVTRGQADEIVELLRAQSTPQPPAPPTETP